jgi:hypothetical protein
MEKSRTPTPAEFFSKYPPEIQSIAMQARQLIFSAMPDAIEQVNIGNQNTTYGTGLKMADQVFYISAHKAHVNIGLFGADLPDPAGLMEGTGKRLRHVKLRKPEDVDKPALRTLLDSALAKHNK